MKNAKQTFSNLALGYTIAGLAFGVFYREFTKLNGIERSSTLGLVHGHLLALGIGLITLAVVVRRRVAAS